MGYSTQANACVLPLIDRRLFGLYIKVMHANLTELEILGIVPFGRTGGSSRFYALRLSHPGWKDWQPGQFVMLRPPNFGLEIPWGRPFSICHMTTRHLICFFRVQGRGTERLAAMRQGEKLLAWGPLGTAFAMDANKPTLLLAGGMGIVPFVGYVNRHPQPWNITMLFGHREPLDCYPVDSINEHVPVDSLREQESGDLDNFIYSLQEKIRDCAEQSGLALACGPTPFLRTVKSIAQETGCRLQVSLENRMACGVGACLGCASRTTERWPDEAQRLQPVQTCLHGPVFWADEIEI